MSRSMLSTTVSSATSVSSDLHTRTTTSSTRRCYSTLLHARTLLILLVAMPTATGQRTVLPIVSIRLLPYLPNVATRRRCTLIPTCDCSTSLRRHSICRHSVATRTPPTRTLSSARHGCGRRATYIAASSRNRSISAMSRSIMPIPGASTRCLPDSPPNTITWSARHSGHAPRA